MTVPWQLAALAALSLATMVALWLRQLRTRDATEVDAAWAGLIGAGAIILCWCGDGDPWRRVIAATLAAAWAMRLIAHLIRRHATLARVEDGRYRRLRESLGPNAARRFLPFYLAQAAAAVGFATTFLAAAHDPRPLGIGDAAAVAWWLATLALVAIADRQLSAWRGDPDNAGRTCRAGLWRASRHPNYFFEWLHWFAYVALGWGAPHAAWALATPAVLLVLLLFVSGIPWAEAQSLRSRGDDYRRYQRATSAFIPWFHRRESP